jgi:hypothetical protein
MARYHAALSAFGHDRETIRLAKKWSAVGKAVHVAETDEQAKAEAFFIKTFKKSLAKEWKDTPGILARLKGSN